MSDHAFKTEADVDTALRKLCCRLRAADHGARDVNVTACWLLIDALLDTRYAMQTAANAQPIAA